MIGVDGVIDVSQRLGLDALGAVHNQQRAFNRAHGAGDLIGEVDVTRSVDQVEDILLPVQRLVVDPHGLGLDRDATLPLDVHAVEHLRLHIAQRNSLRLLDEAISEGGFAMVDVGDDGEIADV